jgi:hypothetical protein
VLDQGLGRFDLHLFGNEVSQDLGFDGGAGSVSDALPHHLQGPFSNPSLCRKLWITTLSRYFETVVIGCASK